MAAPWIGAVQPGGRWIGAVPGASAGGSGGTAIPAALAGAATLPGPVAGGGATATVSTLVGAGTLLAPTAAGGGSAAAAALAGTCTLAAPSASGGAGTPAPLAVADLLAGWLATEIPGATDGDPLGSWPDASGNGHDGTATGARRPTYRSIGINALPVVEATADGQWFDLASPITLPDAYTLYFVASRTADNLLRVLASASGAATIQVNGTTPQVVDDAGTGGISGTFFGGGGAYLWRFRRAGAGQPHRFAASGVAEQTLGLSGPVTLDTLLGKVGAGQSTAAGDQFAAILPYGRDLAGTADDADIQQYFTDNRGVGLIPAPPATATPAALAGTAAILVASAGGSAVGMASPAALAALGSLPAAGAAGGASVSPAVLVGAGLLLAPSASGGAVGTATVAVLVGAGTLPAPGATGGATVAAAVLAARGTILGAAFAPAALDLIDAVCLRLEADATVMALASGVHNQEAPPDTPMPFLEVLEDDDAPDYDSAGALAEGTFRLNAYAGTRDEARALARAARASLFDAALVFGEGELLYLRPGPSSCDLDPDKGPAGDVWHTLIQFRYLVS